MACRIVLTCVLTIPIRFSLAFVVVAFQMSIRTAMAWRIAMMSVQTTQKNSIQQVNAAAVFQKAMRTVTVRAMHWTVAQMTPTRRSRAFADVANRTGSDMDGTLDCDDQCPYDAQKTEPGFAAAVSQSPALRLRYPRYGFRRRWRGGLHRRVPRRSVQEPAGCVRLRYCGRGLRWRWRL